MASSSVLQTSSSLAARSALALAALALAACGGGTTAGAGGGGGGGTGHTLTSVVVVPAAAGASLVIPKGLTLAFTATGHFADGAVEPLTTTVTWTTDHVTVVTTTATPGVVKAVASVGPATQVRATALGITGFATVTVAAPVVTAVTLSPVQASLAAGTTLQYEAAAIFSDGSKDDVTVSAAWDSSVATVATVTPAGLVTGVAVGGATISATLTGGTVLGGSVSASTDLTVTNATLSSIAISPTDPTVPHSVPQQFTATGIFTDGSREDLTAQVDWSSSAPGVATISPDGLATAATSTSGATVITAFRAGVSPATTTLTITGDVLVDLAVDPPSSTVAVGTPSPFTLTGTYSDGVTQTTQDLTALATWSSSDTGVATISNAAGSEGVATGLASGTATMTASFLGSTATATLSVTAAFLTSISVAPLDPAAAGTIAKGLVVQYAAVGTFSDGSTEDLTSAVGWTSSATTVAAVSNALGEEGQVTGLSEGTATVTATFESVSGSATVTVSGATIASLDVTPLSTTVPQGYTRQFRAIATYSDSSTRDLTAQVAWSSSSTTTATISNSAGTQGIATGVGVGTATITAAIPGPSGTVIENTASLQVVSATLQSIAVSPASFTVARRGTAQLTAFGTFTGSLVVDITRQCTWSSGNRGVATVSKTGLVTGVAAGPPVTIKAKKGSRFGTATGTVTP